MRYLFFIILVISINSCTDKGGTPSGILGREKMQAVMWDMIRADAFTEQFIKRDSSKNIFQENSRLQNSIFSIHHVNRSQYLKSYDYYIGHTNLIREVLDSMLAKAQRDRDGIYQQNNKVHPTEKFSLFSKVGADGQFRYDFNPFVYSTKK